MLSSSVRAPLSERSGNLADMTDLKERLWTYLRSAREAMIWKLDGLDEYELRRPMTPTGTNLLGVMKHVGSEEYGYLGEVFGRPAPEQLDYDDANGYSDLWATADESADQIKSFYRRACAHADETIRSLDIAAVGSVPWWGGAHTTLGEMLGLMLGEVNRHLGHVDIVRELVDGRAGLNREHVDFDPAEDETNRRKYVDHLEAVARASAPR